MHFTRSNPTSFIFLEFLPIIFFISSTVSAQQASTPLSRHAIYFEIGGQGILYSVNYDCRVTSHVSLRVGYSSWSFPSLIIFLPGEIRFTGFPLMANYLAGSENSYLELGTGIVPSILSLNGRVFFFGSEVHERTTLTLGTATIAYRYQPVDRGFLFRIGLTPLFTFEVFHISGGISVGYAF